MRMQMHMHAHAEIILAGHFVCAMKITFRKSGDGSYYISFSSQDIINAIVNLVTSVTIITKFTKVTTVTEVTQKKKISSNYLSYSFAHKYKLLMIFGMYDTYVCFS